MSDQDDLVAAALGEVVPIGATPTARELELGEAVARHVSARPRVERTPDPEVTANLASMSKTCPTCGRAYDEGAAP
jgi:hypothetical protein